MNTRLVIGFDLDSTLAHDEGWKGCTTVGRPNAHLVQLVEALVARGHTLCAWSCRADAVVEQWLDSHGLRHCFPYVNESPYPTDSMKPAFDLLIDDRVFRWPANAEGTDGRWAALDVLQLLPNISPIFAPGVTRDADYTDRNVKGFYQGTGQMFIDHFENKWKALWEGHERKRTAFLTICSHAKPYSKSHIHSALRGRLHSWNVLDGLDYIHISGAGIIPSWGEMVYPFNAYDGNMAEATDATRAYLRGAITRRLTEWLNEFSDGYESIVIYLRSQGNTVRAVRDFVQAADDPRVTLVVGEERDEYRLPYALDADPDDVLLHDDNLAKLCDVLRGGV